MNALTKSLLAVATIVSTSLVTHTAVAGESGLLLDDFSAPETTSINTPRIVVDDSSVGGKSQLEMSVKAGVLSADGKIAPARGQPGWVSLALPATADGSGRDLSQFEGIRIRIRIRKGMVSVSANSTMVDNFDYHSAVIPRPSGDYNVVEIPFSSMKRAWSPQTSLDAATIASVSIVAFGVQPSEVAYDIDEIGFY